MEKRWKILQADKSKTDALQESLKINPALCSILIERGFDDFEKAVKTRKLLITNNPGDPHADTNVFAIWRHIKLGR